MTQRNPVLTRSDAFEKRLFGYALAASATVLVSAQPAQAGTIQVSACGDGTQICDSIGRIYIDLLGHQADAAHAQFQLWVVTGTVPGSRFSQFNIAAANAGSQQGVATTSGSGYVANFGNAGLAGAASNFRNLEVTANIGTVTSSIDGSGYWGNWVLHKHGFLGLIFSSGGTEYHGWAELTVDVNGFGNLRAESGLRASQTTGIDVTLNDSGLVDSAVPEPASLALLALGAAGMAAFRLRRRKQ